MKSKLFIVLSYTSMVAKKMIKWTRKRKINIVVTGKRMQWKTWNENLVELLESGVVLPVTFCEWIRAEVFCNEQITWVAETFNGYTSRGVFIIGIGHSCKYVTSNYKHKNKLSVMKMFWSFYVTSKKNRITQFDFQCSINNIFVKDNLYFCHW